MDVSIIVPTYNESQNIDSLLDAIDRALVAVIWEVVVVDDNSPDGTADVVRRRSSYDPRIRLISRVGRRGLSSACIEGVLAASSDTLLIMDADGQHDEKIIPAMLDALKSNGLDVVIGSRYVTGGGWGDVPPFRRFLSCRSAWMARVFTGVSLRDPLSGFFVFKRSFFNQAVAYLYGRGFKILLDLLVSSKVRVKCQEVPYVFRPRYFGKTKLTASVVMEFVRFLIVRGLMRAPQLCLSVVQRHRQ